MISPVVFRSVPKCVRVVSERLFVGPKLGIFGLTRLKKGGDVTLVVDLCRKKRFIPDFEKFFCRLLGIKHVHLSTSLSTITSDKNGGIERIVNLMGKNSTGKTFIHCRHGKHRSVLCAMLFEFKQGRIKLQDLNEFLKKHKFFEFARDFAWHKHTDAQKVTHQLKCEQLRDQFIDTFIKK